MQSAVAIEANTHREGPAPRQEPPRPKIGLPQLLWSRAGLVGAAALSAVLAAALGLVPFFAVARMAPAVFAQPPRLDEVRTLALWVLGAVVVRYVFVALATMLAHVAAFHILHDLRLRLAKKLGAVPLSFFATTTTGELKRTLMDDVNQIEAFVAHNFPDAVAATVAPVLVTLVLGREDWRMALACVAMAPPAFAAMALAMRDVGKAHAKWFEIQDRMNTSLLEYLRGIQVIKTFGLSARSFGDLSRSIEEGLTWMERFMRTNGRGYGAFGALIGSSLVVLVPLGGWLHLEGSLSLESLVLFLILGPQLLLSLLRLMFAWGNVDRIQQGNARIARVLCSEELRDAPPLGRPIDDTITFDHVSFRYGAEGPVVLNDVSFEAKPGTITALVGPSGAGKTTLARLLPRLWEPSEGAVRLGGVDVRELPLDALLGRVSIVFQDVFLFHGTVRENLRLARADADDEALHAACRAARAHDFILRLPQGYDTVLGERGARLSGGEKQRLSIARALLKDAPILVLDEAMAFADAENEARIQEALSELCRGRTVLVIAHRLSSIASADQIVVLEHGAVRDLGKHEALLERCALYQALWDSHTRALDWSLGAPSTARAEVA